LPTILNEPPYFLAASAGVKNTKEPTAGWVVLIALPIGFKFARGRLNVNNGNALTLCPVSKDILKRSRFLLCESLWSKILTGICNENSVIAIDWKDTKTLDLFYLRQCLQLCW